MIIRSILNMMLATDPEVRLPMGTFENEEEESYGCEIVERGIELGEFLRWNGEIWNLKKESTSQDESITSRARKACQDMDITKSCRYLAKRQTENTSRSE
jgi:hypothetical protein